jgi:hypothetical protein
LIRDLLRSRWLIALLALTLVAIFFAYQWDTSYSLGIGAVLLHSILGRLVLRFCWFVVEDTQLKPVLGVLEQEWLTEPLKHANALVNLGVLAYWITELIPGWGPRRAPWSGSLDHGQAT